MDSSRFRMLTDAYGGDVARWPPKERAGARWFELRHPLLAARMRAGGRELDNLLAHYRPLGLSSELTERIAAAALGRLPARRRRSVGGAIWIGAGLAAACASGVLTALVVTPMTPSAAESSLLADPAEDAVTALRDPVDLGEV